MINQTTRIADVLFPLLGLLLLSVLHVRAEEPGQSLGHQAWAHRHDDGLLNRPDLQAIVEIQSRRKGAALRQFFTKEDPLARARAAFGAASVQDPALLPDLVKLLDDPDARVRVDAAFALRQTPGAPSQPLWEHLLKEQDPAAQAMLFGALGFRGDRATHQKIFAKTFPEQEAAYILCAIYYLQRDICSAAVIDRMVKRLDHKDPWVREQAGYFFYVMKRQGMREPGLVDRLVTWMKTCDYDDPAGAFVIRYIAFQGREPDLNLLVEWSRKGGSLRARSVALEGLGFLTQWSRARTALIEAISHAEFQMAETACELLAACDELTGKEIEQIKEALTAGRVHPRSQPHLLGLLWRRGDRPFVEAAIRKGRFSDSLDRIAAISVAPDIDLNEIAVPLEELLRQSNPQVNMLTGVYLAQRFAVVDDAANQAIFNRFFEEAPEKKVRSEALFELAHSLSSKQTEEEIAARFLERLTSFEAKQDIPMIAATLVILGDTQRAEVLPVLTKYSKSENDLLHVSAEGAIQLHKNGNPKPINHCELDFAPVMKMNWEKLRAYGRHPRFVFETNRGAVVVEIDAEQAPMAAQNMITHIERGGFNKLHFYRLVPNHVVQAGPQGNFGYKILSEFTRIPKVEHTFGIGDYGKDTASQHFAITHLMRPHNEGKYTNLGLVIEGREVVKRLEKFDRILKARVVPDPNR